MYSKIALWAEARFGQTPSSSSSVLMVANRSHAPPYPHRGSANAPRARLPQHRARNRPWYCCRCHRDPASPTDSGPPATWIRRFAFWFVGPTNTLVAALRSLSDRSEQHEPTVIGEVLVVLDVQGGQQQPVGQATSGDPHVVDWAGTTTADGGGREKVEGGWARLPR